MITIAIVNLIHNVGTPPKEENHMVQHPIDSARASQQQRLATHSLITSSTQPKAVAQPVLSQTNLASTRPQLVVGDEPPAGPDCRPQRTVLSAKEKKYGPFTDSPDNCNYNSNLCIVPISSHDNMPC
jgi:hypothetical protein